jgi:hypothetical protein
MLNWLREWLAYRRLDRLVKRGFKNRQHGYVDIEELLWFYDHGFIDDAYVDEILTKGR